MEEVPPAFQARLQADMAAYMDERLAAIQANVAAAAQQAINQAAAVAAPAPENRSRVQPAKPSKYDGRKPADQWVFEVEQYFNAVRIEGRDRVNWATAMLTDSAALWWRYTSADAQPIETWEEFKADLIHNFKHLDTLKAARKRLRYLRQRTSVAAFYAEFMRLVLQIPGITEDEKMDRFLSGLKPNLQREVTIRNPDTFKEMVKLAHTLDPLFFNPNRPSSGTLFGRLTAAGPGGAEPMELGSIDSQPGPSRPFGQRPRLTEADKERFRQEGRCFYCKELGHIALRCPNKRGNEKRAGKAPAW